MKINMLIIEDHPAIIAGYKSILDFNSRGYDIHITVAHDCESAYKIITNPHPTTFFDIVFLDVILPPYHLKKIDSGEVLGSLIKSYMPTSKLVLLTSYTQAFILYKIFKELNPDGLLVKSDFTPEELLIAFNAILDGERYHTETVTKSLKELLKNDGYIDSHNRQIISLLTQGVKTKNMPAHLGLSISAIDKRKSIIKSYFGIEKGTDEDIIKAARKNGFI